MGPIVVFDKSFLQSLNVDESVWFDKFFNTVIVPYFYVETLADLSKSPKRNKSAEEEVSIIAEKTPEQSSTPTSYHIDLLINDLLGNTIETDGRPHLPGGTTVKSDGKIGVNFKLTPEHIAFSRWMDGDFYNVEKDAAGIWRKAVSELNFDNYEDDLLKNSIDYKSCKNLEDASLMAKEFVNKELDNIYYLVKLIFDSFPIPTIFHQQILFYLASNSKKRLSLKNLAPYAAYILSVEVFFKISIVRGFISKDRKSNKIDISYLYYLPFGMIFVSSDKLHKKCALLFLNSNQEFIWGQDLKKGLKEINEYYLALPDEIKEKGLFTIASAPPKDKKFLVSRIWAKYMNFDFNVEDEEIIERNPKKDKDLLDKLKRMHSGEEVEGFELLGSSPDFINMEKSIRKKKGSWYQLPKDFEG